MFGTSLPARCRNLACFICLIYVGGLSACAGRPAPDTPAAAGGASLESQVVQYVAVQEALAADSYTEARAALEDLVTVADAATAPLARSAAAAGDIETMRARFKPLSEYLAAQELPQRYARAFCPMYDGGSNWVQVDGPVRNPYYGSTMLTCGVVDAAPGAHMDHSPRHGGTVFMAPDSFHHIEGTYPEPGVFRLYATDNYRDPVDMSAWSGRVVLEEGYDAATDEYTEVVAFDLQLSADGTYLEAALGEVPVPVELIAKAAFDEDFPEERFDFFFLEHSSEAPANAAVGPAADARSAWPAATTPLAERIRPTIPEQTSDIVADISARDEEVQALIGSGRFTEIFLPALQAKELALALSDRAADLPGQERNALRIAVRHLVRAAWLLDWYGDLGNKQQVSGAYEIFGTATSEISRLYGQAP